MSHAQQSQPDAHRGTRGQLWLIAAAAMLAHAPALRAGFVLDDTVLLSENPYVRTVSGLSVLLRHELFVASAQPRIVPYYRPLSGLLNWLSYQAFGANAPLQHALNLVLHALVTLLLIRRLERLSVRPLIARSLGLLFAVHPATSEVVAYLGGRQDMLGWIVALMSLFLLDRQRRLGSGSLVALGLVATLLGALCHEFFLAWSVPLACLAATDSDIVATQTARSRGAATLFGGVMAVPALLLLRRGLHLADYEVTDLGFAPVLRATVGVAARLAKDVLLPTDLAVDVTVWLPSVALAAGIGVLTIAVTGWLVWIVWCSSRALLGLLLAGFSIVSLAIGLHAGVAIKYGNISDRYAYAVLVGVVFVGAALVERTARQRMAETGPPLLAFARRSIGVALAMALIPLTWSRDTSWRDETALQLAMIEDRPNDPESQLAAGMLHFANEDLERAYPHCVAYRRARPQSEKANLCIGIWLLLHRHPSDAVEVLRPYALSRPGVQSARRAFLAALFANHDYTEARQITDDWLAQFPGAEELLQAKHLLESPHPSSPSPLSGEEPSR